EIDGHHATQTLTARPLWQSASNDVLFDGSNDYLTTTNFYFRDRGNFAATYYAGVAGAGYRVMMGIYSTVTDSEYGSLGAYNGTNTTYGSVGGIDVVGTTSIQGGMGTALFSQNNSTSEIYRDG